MSASLKSSMIEHSEWRDDIRSHTPLGRIASPAELADAVQFLAAESSGFMTGEIITVDGGRSLLDAVSVPAH
jgi:7-alpha-hydroxysteroid dehydrogenase